MPDARADVASGRRYRPSEPGDDIENALTVRAALLLDAMRAGAPEVVAGQVSLERPIRWVHSGELTTIADSLLGGELLLTTGTAIPREDDAARRYIAELAGRSVAALCIELGGPFASAPRVLVEECDRYAVPLVVFHEPVRFVTVTEEIHTLLVDRRFALLREVQAAEDVLLAIASRGGRAQDIVDELAAQLNNPVAMVSGSGAAIVAANPARLDRDARAWWPELSPRTGRVWQEASVPASVHLAPGSSLVAVVEGALLPAFAGKLLERAARIITLAAPPALGRDRAAEEHGALVGEILAGASEARLSRLMSRLGAVGFDISAPRFVPFVIGCPDGGYRDAEEWESVADALRKTGSRRESLIVASRPAGGVHGVLAVRSEQDRVEGAGALARRVREILHADRSAVTLVMAQAVPAHRLSAELIVADQSPIDSDIAATAEWVDTRLLEGSRFRWSVRNLPETHQFVSRVLGPFVGSEAAAHAPLVETLRVYCETLGQKAETARLLHLNRQSLYARLARIEDLLSISLDDRETIATFRTALQLADAQRVRLGR
jgi:PucR family transcriptional regulator, purine catabolism regulatory protein